MIIHVVVPAARAPSASHAMAPGATLAPVTTTSTAARTRERGQEQGRTRYMNGQEVPCPPRALKGSHSRSFAANHSQSKLLLNGSVLAVSCSSQALDAGSIPVTRSIHYFSSSMVCGNESSPGALVSSSFVPSTCPKRPSLRCSIMRLSPSVISWSAALVACWSRCRLRRCGSGYPAQPSRRHLPAYGRFAIARIRR